MKQRPQAFVRKTEVVVVVFLLRQVDGQRGEIAGFGVPRACATRTATDLAAPAEPEAVRLRKRLANGDSQPAGSLSGGLGDPVGYDDQTPVPAPVFLLGGLLLVCSIRCQRLAQHVSRQFLNLYASSWGHPTDNPVGTRRFPRPAGFPAYIDGCRPWSRRLVAARGPH